MLVFKTTIDLYVWVVSLLSLFITANILDNLSYSNCPTLKKESYFFSTVSI